MRLLLTVPHAVAGVAATSSHPSDTAAVPFAREIGLGFAELARGTNTYEVLEADEPRSVIDANRPWSQDTAWRARLLASVPDVHIDVHSYPASYAGFANLDFVVMSHARPKQRDAEVAEVVCFQTNARVGLVVAPGMTDITTQVESYTHVPTWAIEISEGLSAETRKKIAEVVAAEVAQSSHQQTDSCKTLDPRVLCFFHITGQMPLRTPLWIPAPSPWEPQRPLVCATCGSDEATRLCSVCATVAYCNEEHQKADWGRHCLICPLVGGIKDVTKYLT